MKISRHKEIMEIIEQYEIISYTELAKILGVSTMTVRRDVDELEKENAVIKEHGGIRRAFPVKTTTEKLMLHVEEKNYIAQKAIQLIQPNSVVYLGAGTSILCIAKQLKKDHKFIITNSLLTFNWLVENHFDNILLTGGEFFTKTEEFHGVHAERLVNDFSIDYAFIATNGLAGENMTTSSPFFGRLQAQVIKQSKKVYLVADSSKFNSNDSYIFGNVKSLTAIITDSHLDAETKAQYEQIVKIIN